MTAIASTELIAEVEGAVRGSSPDRHAYLLRQVTGLLLSCADRLSTHQLDLFDDVILRLMEPVDARALAKLSVALSELKSAPAKVLRCLAFHEDAAVAAPVLLKSQCLSERQFIDIAAKGSQQHLAAISGRPTLAAPLTDALLRRGDTNVCRLLAKRAEAQFSHQGYGMLAAAAERDDDVADLLIHRPEISPDILDELLVKATNAFRARLLRIAPAPLREPIRIAIENIAARDRIKRPQPTDYCEAQSAVLALSKGGRLNDSAVNRFAVRNERSNLIAALSLLADVAIDTIETLVEQNDRYGLLVACRASRLNWQTAVAVISNGKGAQRLPQQELEQLKEAFEAQCLSTAQWEIRFGSLRDSAAKGSSANSAFAAAGTDS